MKKIQGYQDLLTQSNMQKNKKELFKKEIELLLQKTKEEGKGYSVYLDAAYNLILSYKPYLTKKYVYDYLNKICIDDSLTDDQEEVLITVIDKLHYSEVYPEFNW